MVLVSALLSFTASAQEIAPSNSEASLEYHEKRYTIFFPAGLSEVQEDYKDNGKTLQTMLEDLTRTISFDGSIPDSLTIFASTSPEGPASLNKRLAIERANNTKKILVEMFPQFKEENIRVTFRANDWSGMSQRLRQDTTLLYRNELLAVINNPDIDSKDWYIRYKMKPEVYASVRDALFDNMRTSSVTISVVRTIDTFDEYVANPDLYITSPSPIEMTYEGGKAKITYSKNVPDETIPVADCDSIWISGLTSTADSATFIVSRNESPVSRSTVIKLECYGKSHEVIVNQTGIEPELILTSESMVSIPAAGGVSIVTFEKNIDNGVVPVVKSLSADLTIVESNEGTAVISVAENKTKEERKHILEIDYYGKKCVVEVIQNAPDFHMAVKTNTLYDLAMIPNVGIEFYLGKNFSIAANWMFSWWHNDQKHWFWRTYGGDVAARYWFGKRADEKPLSGHHVGLYGNLLTYDFEAGGRGYLGAKLSYGGGLEYGYSLPIARRLNLDFNLGVGYLGGEYEEYLPIDGHYVWQVTKHRHWFGPTKAEISLSWLLGRGNINNDKGGKR